ncbi:MULTISPECIES: TetR/AcrR family transcriptional regulator [unclassified Bacillus (in: firmicutes)]|uniref:TetR/AcrR family transcriptional regulator n=1 Tax=unclassified Bacillus (in: firmicutes) TaxID=185979 RepID=UPI0008E572D6|nr:MULTISPECIES: TetR/AcrR family transcriptional regulator [unclassified Bacillus (in: firmicutes)]SFA87394.1 DNA-binding transcriptional regulator, AcrR family [Bacillus sp. UNCCL13]SFQ84216.1 DNA-binding transcriptional regulator, AcrR family [Bacillus sp. cl95]
MAPIVSDEYKEKKKREILDSALACFAKKGFQAATIDDIVAHSGISKGSIYNYFKSKDEIYLSLMVDNTTETNQRLLEEISKYSTAVEKIRYLFGTYLDFEPFAEKNKANVLVHYEFKLHSSRSEELLAYLKKRRQQYFIDLVADIIEDGQSKGDVKKELNARLYAEMFWSILDGVTLQTVYDDYPYHEALKEMQELFIEKLSAPL